MCTVGCEAGTFSESGFQPCEPCALGTYQSEQGRTYCLSCGKGIPTRRRQATGFHDCVVKGNTIAVTQVILRASRHNFVKTLPT